MTIPFTKAHGAGNDFLLSWSDRVPAGDLPEMARAICDRHTGVGADGWILLRNSRKTECGAKQFLICTQVRAAPFALLSC